MWTKIKKGDTDTLLNLLPFLVIAAEMYSDEDARKGLEFLVKTVGSPDDILAWIDYLALPADGEGWDNDGTPEQVIAFPDESEQASFSLLDLLIPQATAAGKLKRLAGVPFGKVLASVKKHAGKEGRKLMPSATRLLKESLSSANVKSMRKYVHSKEMLGITAGMLGRAGARQGRNLIRGKTNLRYHPAALLAFLSYLEWENACGRALDDEAAGQNQDDNFISSSDLGCNGIGVNSAIRYNV